MALSDTQDIIDFFEDLIDDTVDSDFALSLAENAKNIIEGTRHWRMLVKEDTSNTFGSGETYLDAKSLPSDFFMDDMVYLGIQADKDYGEPMDAVPFNLRRKYCESGKYAIDYANNNLYILDTVTKTYTIYFYYIYITDELTLTTGPVWPKKYWRLIAFLMASLYKKGVDFDDINISQALAYDAQASLLWQEMRDWDDRLANKAVGGRTRYKGEQSGPQSNKIDIYND